MLRIDHVEFNLLAEKQPRVSSILMKNISANLATHVVRMNNDASSVEYIPSRQESGKQQNERLVLNDSHMGN